VIEKVLSNSSSLNLFLEYLLLFAAWIAIPLIAICIAKKFLYRKDAVIFWATSLAFIWSILYYFYALIFIINVFPPSRAWKDGLFREGVTKLENPRQDSTLWRVVDELSREMGIIKPDIYHTPDMQSGRGNIPEAKGWGLLHWKYIWISESSSHDLDEDKLSAFVAHELAHLKLSNESHVLAFLANFFSTIPVIIGAVTILQFISKKIKVFNNIISKIILLAKLLAQPMNVKTLLRRTVVCVIFLGLLGLPLLGLHYNRDTIEFRADKLAALHTSPEQMLDLMDWFFQRKLELYSYDKEGPAWYQERVNRLKRLAENTIKKN